jgi:hypothetical protein
MQASTPLSKQMMYQMIMKWKAVPNMVVIITTEMVVLRISGWGSCQTKASRTYFKINSDNKITTSRAIFSTKTIMTPITSARITSKRKNYWKVSKKPAIKWCARAANPTLRHLLILMVTLLIQVTWMHFESLLETTWMQLSLKLSTDLLLWFQTWCEEKIS